MSDAFSNVSYEAYKQAASEYFKAAQANASIESLENGHKALVILYFNLSEEGDLLQQNEAELTLKAATRVMLEHELAAISDHE